MPKAPNTYKALNRAMGKALHRYQMIADDGVEFDAIIPAFRLSIPNVLH